MRQTLLQVFFIFLNNLLAWLFTGDVRWTFSLEKNFIIGTICQPGKQPTAGTKYKKKSTNMFLRIQESFDE